MRHPSKPRPSLASRRSGRALALALAAAALGVACPSAQPSRPRDAGRPRPPAAVAPSFRREIAPVLDRQCAATEGCHGDRPAESIDLDLRPSRSWRALVGRPASIRDGALLVAPGDPARSFLMAKLTGELRHGEGKAMPLDPETGAPPSRNPLDPGFVDRVLRRWIERGAPDD